MPILRREQQAGCCTAVALARHHFQSLSTVNELLRTLADSLRGTSLSSQRRILFWGVAAMLATERAEELQTTTASLANQKDTFDRVDVNDWHRAHDATKSFAVAEIFASSAETLRFAGAHVIEVVEASTNLAARR